MIALGAICLVMLAVSAFLVLVIVAAAMVDHPSPAQPEPTTDARLSAVERKLEALEGDGR